MDTIERQSAADSMETNAMERNLVQIDQRPSPVVAPSAVTPMQMLQIAVERGADLAMLSKLMDLQERWEANEARKAFVAAMGEFKAEPPDLEKNKHVSYKTDKGKTEYDHATLDHVSEEIGKALARHGLSHRWEVEQVDHDVIRVSCVLTHARGHSERVTLSAKPDASGGKNSIQAIGSAVTYLERYTLLAATGLAAKGQDDDSVVTSANPISAAQKDTLVALLKETGADVRRFLQYIGAATVDEIPATKFESAKASLERKKAEKKGAPDTQARGAK